MTTSPAIEDVAANLETAIRLLEGYAAYDERIGHSEDADFTRSHIAKMKLALPRRQLASNTRD